MLRSLCRFAAVACTLPPFAPSALAAPALVEVHRTTLAESAHASDGTDRMRDGKTRFAGPLGGSAVSHAGHQYAVYYTGKNRGEPKAEQAASVVVARRRLDGGAWERAVLPGHTVTSEDAHNRQAIAISAGDGVIHLAFDHHNTPVFRYARTAAGVADHPERVAWNQDVFALTPNLGVDLGEVSVTYPAFTAFPGGNLVVYYREGASTAGDMRLAKYDSAQGRWGALRNVSTREGTHEGQSTTRGPYLAGGMQVGPDGELRMTWVFREKKAAANQPPGGSERYANHGLFHAASFDEGLTWHRNDGSPVADTRKGETLGIDNIGPAVVPIPRELGPSNVTNVSAIDPATGETHVFIEHNLSPSPADGSAVHHYVRSPQGQWSGGPTAFDASGIALEFAGDRLFAFGGRGNPGAWFAPRASGFQDFTPLPLVGPDGSVLDFPRGGFATWDLGRLGEGFASLLWQEPPAHGEAGQPSPIHVFDFRATDLD